MRLKDLTLDASGDLVLGSNGDLACSYDDDVLVENIIFRLKTYAGDYALEPTCGASLEDFIGAPNTEELGDLIRTNIYNSLTNDGFIKSDEVTIDIAPISASEIVISIIIDGIQGNFSVISTLDLLTGRLNIL